MSVSSLWHDDCRLRSRRRRLVGVEARTGVASAAPPSQSKLPHECWSLLVAGIPPHERWSALGRVLSQSHL